MTTRLRGPFEPGGSESELDRKILAGKTYCELCSHLDTLDWTRVEEVFGELDALRGKHPDGSLPATVTLDGREFEPAWKWVEAHIGGGGSWAHANAKIVHNSDYRRTHDDGPPEE